MKIIDENLMNFTYDVLHAKWSFLIFLECSNIY